MSNRRDFTKKNPQFTGDDNMFVPKGTTGQRSGGPVEGMVRYNTDLGFLEQYNAAGWAGIDAPPTLSSISPTSFDGSSGITITLTGTNFKSGSTVKFITANGAELSAGTVTFVNSTSIQATIPRNILVSEEPLDVKVQNPSGLSAVLEDALDAGDGPTWSTGAGSIATIYDSGRSSISLSVSATDPDGGSVTYSLQSGSVPSGLTFNSNGTITGNANSVGSDTISTFTVRASDSVGNTADRSFSITVKSPVTNSFTNTGSSTFSVPTGVSSVEVLVIGGGGAGGGATGFEAGGGGGAGGFVSHPSFPVTPGGTVAVNVGTGGSGLTNQPNNPQPGSGFAPANGGPSTFGSLTALGGGHGGGQYYNGIPGGSGGGEGGNGYGSPGPGTQPGQSNPGASQYGNPGGASTPGLNANSAGAAGGGAGGGGSPAGSTGGPGGSGRASSISGSPVTYAGGGGGAGNQNGSGGGSGGPGGGGNGSSSYSGSSGSGTTNRGGGGGGGCGPVGSPTGNGGPGIVIVKY